MAVADYFKKQAQECRTIALEADRIDRRALLQLAAHYEQEARKAALSNGHSHPHP